MKLVEMSVLLALMTLPAYGEAKGVIRPPAPQPPQTSADVNDPAPRATATQAAAVSPAVIRLFDEPANRTTSLGEFEVVPINDKVAMYYRFGATYPGKTPEDAAKSDVFLDMRFTSPQEFQLKMVVKSYSGRPLVTFTQSYRGDKVRLHVSQEVREALGEDRSYMIFYYGSKIHAVPPAQTALLRTLILEAFPAGIAPAKYPSP